MRHPSARRGWWAVPAAIGLVAAACTSPPTVGEAETEPEPSEDDGEETTAADGEDAAPALPECPLDALDEAGGPVEVTLWFGGLVGLAAQTMDETVERFNASQDDVVVRASNQSPDYRETFRVFESAASANREQLPDVIFVENVQLAAMVDGGLVLPAQACMEADGFDLDTIEPLTRATYTVDDVFYPGYVNMSNAILYYNKAHWAQAGLDPDDPPGTLDELVEQARTLKEAGVSERPFSLNLTENFFSNWVNGGGVDVVDNANGREGAPTEATFDAPETRELFERLVEMNDEGLLNPFGRTEGGIEHVLAVVTEQSSMVLETSTGASTIAEALGGGLSADEVAGVDVEDLALENIAPGSGPFPGLDAPGQIIPGGGAFYILNTSSPAEQAASWRFLRFMLEEDSVREWAIGATYLPILADAPDDPVLQEYWADDPGGVLVRPGVEQLAASAGADRPSALIGPYVDFQDIIERALEAVLLTGADIETSLAQAESDMTTSLQRYTGE